MHSALLYASFIRVAPRVVIILTLVAVRVTVYYFSYMLGLHGIFSDMLHDVLLTDYTLETRHPR